MIARLNATELLQSGSPATPFVWPQPLPPNRKKVRVMDRSRLVHRAGTVSNIFSFIATLVIILGIVAGFIHAVADAADTFQGAMAGLLVALAIGIYVAVAWAGIQMFALVAGYIHERLEGGSGST